jgi:hypothetical protein
MLNDLAVLKRNRSNAIQAALMRPLHVWNAGARNLVDERAMSRYVGGR